MRNALFLIVLMGCGDCHGCGGNSGETGDSGGNKDTNPTVTVGTATLTYTVSVLGEEAGDAAVNVECEAQDFVSTRSGETTTVEAPSSCLVTAGDEEYTDEFGYPIYAIEVDEDTVEYWAAPPVSLTVEPDQTVTGDFSAFKLFVPGNYSCEYDKYALDEGADEMKGEWMRNESVDTQFISVDQNGIVEAEDNANMSVIGRDDDHMKIQGANLTLVSDSENPSYISQSNIDIETFSLTVVNTESKYVADVRCGLDE